MTTVFFDVFVMLMAGLVVATTARFVAPRPAAGVAAGLVAWFAYVWALAASGVVQNVSMRPPGTVFLVGPVVVFLALFLLRGKIISRFFAAVPLWLLLGMQSFRIGVELFLHQFWLEGIVPKMLTFGGVNVDIYVGLSAPLIAWVARRGKLGLRAALVWNVLGLLALANVVIRAILSAPGPLNWIHTEVSNLLLGSFPYMFVPGFFVPLALVLHVLAVRRLLHVSGDAVR